jgi:hypothetical protein
MSPSAIATHVCFARTRPALANGRLFVDDTPRHDPAIRLDLGVVWPKIVLANHTFEFPNAGISQRTANFIAGVGCVCLLDVEVMVVRLDVIDRLLLHLVKGRRLAVRLYKCLGGGGKVFVPSRGVVDEGGGVRRAFPFLSVGL